MEQNSAAIIDRANPSSKIYALTWKSVDAVERYARKRYRHLDQRLVSYLELRKVRALLVAIEQPYLRILDVPSGYGRFTGLLQSVAGKLLNADLNLYALKYQLQNLVKAPPVMLANVLQLPLQSGSCDLVFNFRLLQHFKQLEQQQALLAELSRVTRQYVLISVYHPTGFHRLTQLLNPQAGKMHMLDKALWQKMLSECGLRAIKCRRILPWLHAQHIYLLKKVNAIE